MSSNLTKEERKKPEYEVIDHIGWELWKATEVWKKNLVNRLVRRGFSSFAEARYGLLRHIGPDGASQTEITSKANLTKQAVQQQIDDLVKDGIVVRYPDPYDARKKHISLTRDGRRLFAEMNEVKLEIERQYELQIGAKRMAMFRKVLADISCPQPEG